MRFRKPPISEAWIEYHFETSEHEETWTPDCVESFVGGHPEGFSNNEILLQGTLSIKEVTRPGQKLTGTVDRVPSRFRTFDAEERQCIEFGRQLLIFRSMRCETDYIGFHLMLGKAFEHFTRYVDIFHPHHVRKVVLHYSDQITLPVPTDAPVDLNDYFNIGVRLPSDPDGMPISAFALSIQIPIIGANPGPNYLELALRSEPHSPDSSGPRFSMEWNGVCDELNTLSQGLLTERIERIHERMNAVFEQSFTQQTLEFFEPIGE